MPSGSEEEESDQGAARSERAESSAGNGGRGGGERKSGASTMQPRAAERSVFQGFSSTRSPFFFCPFVSFYF